MPLQDFPKQLLIYFMIERIISDHKGVAALFSRPGRSQGLLYKQLRHWLINSLSEWAFSSYSAATPKRLALHAESQVVPAACAEGSLRAAGSHWPVSHMNVYS